MHVDGLDQQWVNGVPSDWEGPLFSQLNGAEAPFAIQQLNAVATTLVGLPRLERIDTSSGMAPAQVMMVMENS